MAPGYCRRSLRTIPGECRPPARSVHQQIQQLDQLDDRAQAIARAEAALKIFETIEHPYAAKARAQLEKWKGDRGK